MKRIRFWMLTVAIVGMLALPALAQKGKGKDHAKGKSGAANTMSDQGTARTNKGGDVRGQERASEVKGMNQDAKSDRMIEKDLKKSSHKGKGSAKGKTKMKTHGKSAEHKPANQ